MLQEINAKLDKPKEDYQTKSVGIGTVKLNGR